MFSETIWTVDNAYHISFGKPLCDLCGINYIVSWGVTFIFFHFLYLHNKLFSQPMEVVSTVYQKSKEDTSISWVDPAILVIVFIFTGESNLERAFLDVGHSFDWTY